MAKRMLIDTAHPEETRVVVVSGNRIEEFDFEAAAKKPLKGNIYLAKVTRVEPSLQAAFVDYGGNRHGFLAFSEIHPDYYQIPIADRQALIAQQEAESRRAELEQSAEDGSDVGEAMGEETPGEPSLAESGHEGSAPDRSDAPALEGEASETMAFDDHDTRPEDEASGAEASGETAGASDAPDTEESVGPSPPASSGEVIEVPPEPKPQVLTSRGGDDIEDALEETRGRRVLPHGRPYKIQEVIKRRQILLVQVVKEERGNKGAALTTYLSLAGRYGVLMPNTARGGGISRKITNAGDRKRLKSAAAELDIPQGMGLIIRTAGANRTRAEIKRDYEYLLRVWESVRDLTLRSSAPALVYEEGNLIKRAIRDLYSKDVTEVLVDGEEGYKEAKTFMRTLMPSHAKVVQPYKDRLPLFQRFQIESLLDQMFNPVVTLRSGGYVVLNQTEALVAIDVNSGRATREHSIEETALRTNLEAADEIARQLRLRDLAGLIVIDFIDMEEGRNNRAVEKRLKDALKVDRARIQIGRISSFGLLEMSRQRLRAGVVEGSTIKCPHCEGTGIVRSVESSALRVLRAVEEEALKDRTAVMTVRVPPNVALYVLNNKRRDLIELEQRYDITCQVTADDTLAASAFALDRTVTREARARTEPTRETVRLESAFVAEPEEGEGEPVVIAEVADEEAHEAAETEAEVLEGREEAPPPRNGEGEGDGRRRRRRRRRRGGHRGDDERAVAGGERSQSGPPESRSHDSETDEDDDGMSEPPGGAETSESGEWRESHAGPRGDGGNGEGRRRRRRGRRGGRRNRRPGEERMPDQPANGLHLPRSEFDEIADVFEASERAAERGEAEGGSHTHTAPFDENESWPSEQADDEAEQAGQEPSDEIGDDAVIAHEPAPRDVTIEPVVEIPSASAYQAHTPRAPEPVAPEPAATPTPAASQEPPRRGWWQRRFGG